MLAKNRVLAELCVAVLVCAAGPAAGQEDEASMMQDVLTRHRRMLLSAGAPGVERVRGHARSLEKDGTWPDIDYGDDHRAGWRAHGHLVRVRRMCIAFRVEDGPLSGDPAVRSAALRALDHWLRHRYQNSNWWWNEIGVPRAMRDIAVLLGEDLTDQRRQGVLAVLDQHRVRGTGANLAWSAELKLHAACLAGDAEAVAEAATLIWKEVSVGEEEGIQPDRSFFQHGPRLQAFAYGKSFVNVVVPTAWLLRETPWAMPAERQSILSSYLLDGLQWMCRGVYTVPGTLDRAVSRKGSMRNGDLRRLLRMWRRVDDRRAEELAAFLARQEEKGEPLVGWRHFPRAEFTCHHRPAGSVFLKTMSERTRPTERINDENLRGVPYLHGGDHYIVRDGREYHDLQPVWDWSSLPGLTGTDRAAELERRPFVGGTGDGRSGAVGMDYRRRGEGGTVVAARKLWAFHGDYVVCLIGGWRCERLDGPVRTSLEQCRLRGPVRVGSADGPARELDAGDPGPADATWALHHGVGYVPLTGRLGIRIGPAKGSWGDINSRYAGKERVTENVFALHLDHGDRPEAGGFVLVLGADGKALDALATETPWSVLANGRNVQCIRFADGTGMAAFHGGGEVGEAGLSVDRACVLMWRGRRIRAADPTGSGGRLNVTLDGRTHRLGLPETGKTVTAGDGQGPSTR
jgi:chondroitin AC lyase